jgi:hypothetical protein
MTVCPPAPRTLGFLALPVILLFPVQAVQAEDDAQALARLRKEIAEAIGVAACGSVSACRILPMGSDACGNPTVWVPFNNAQDLKIIVETKAAEYTFIEEDQYRGKTRPAVCKPAVAPKQACVNKKCVLGEASY